MRIEYVPHSVDSTEAGTALVLENGGDIAALILIVDFWNRRWSPTEDFILQRVPNNIVQELKDAWKLTTEKENE